MKHSKGPVNIWQIVLDMIMFHTVYQHLYSLELFKFHDFHDFMYDLFVTVFQDHGFSCQFQNFKTLSLF